MKKYFIIPLLLAIIAQNSLFSEEQPDQAAIDKIVSEGFLLYNLERAAWISTDTLVSHYDYKKIGLQGYFSYNIGKDFYCVYLKLDNSVPKAFVTYYFLDTVREETMLTDPTLRPLNEYESLIYKIREHLLTEALFADSMFWLPKGSKFNIDFIRDADTIKVFLLTSIEKPYTIPFGNDYQLNYDMNGNLFKKYKLHQTFFPIDYSKGGDTTEMIMHSHTPLSSEYMTSTDICNFLLYGPTRSPQGSCVISRKWKCIFNNKPGMIVISREKMDKTGESIFDKPKEIK